MSRVVSAHVSDRAVVAYFGHHKCASTWIGEILARVAGDIGLRYTVVADKQTPLSTGPLTDYGATFDRGDLRRRIDDTRADLVACVTADREQADVLHAARAFHVIRDPRDIVVSAYFSHRDSHSVEGLPHMLAHRDALRATTRAAGLLLEMEFSKTAILQMGEWDYAQESVLEVKMEELTRDPYGGFLRIFDHLALLSDVEPSRAAHQARVWTARLLNRAARRSSRFGRLRRPMSATGEILLGAVYAQRFEAQTAGRRRGCEDVTSHYRKGVEGDWINYFSRHHIEAFQWHFGDLVERLGYDTGAE